MFRMIIARFLGAAASAILIKGLEDVSKYISKKKKGE
tara:strand:+ start:447 stop:557 length:111 start_codon:yes stop_codon:yes gene_type:complete